MSDGTRQVLSNSALIPVVRTRVSPMVTAKVDKRAVQI